MKRESQIVGEEVAELRDVHVLTLAGVHLQCSNVELSALQLSFLQPVLKE